MTGIGPFEVAGYLAHGQRPVRTALLVAAFAGALLSWTSASAADTQRYGIFERISESSGSFDQTLAALEAALQQSRLILHGKTDLALGPQAQRGRVYVLTSPDYLAAAAEEPPNTASAQILRLGVYEYGRGRKTQLDMTNPVAHAMVFYAGSKNYDKLLSAAKSAAQELRDVASKVPGAVVSVPLPPMRTEEALNGFDGDGAARMMAHWRNWSESQRTILSDKAENFGAVVERVEGALRAAADGGADDPSGWRLVSKVQVGPNAVYFGLTNAYTENKCVRIDSDFRSDGKADDAPLPGVDHVPALPLEVLVYNDGKLTKAVQYGQMWRMQLYFWDAGYVAFAKNAGVPDTLVNSIDTLLKAPAVGTLEPGGKEAK
jgi:hypothetical protein